MMPPLKSDNENIAKIMDKVYNLLDIKLDVLKDILTQIHTTLDTKMELIAEKLSTGDSITKQHTEVMEQQNTYTNAAIEACASTISEIQKHIQADSENNKAARSELHALKIEEHAYRRKQTMKSLWYTKLNIASQKYEQYIQNSTRSSFYEQWGELGTFLPKKFRKNTSEMNEEQKFEAGKEGFQNMKIETEKMKSVAKQALIRMEEISEQMNQLIQTREMKNVAAKLIQIWGDELQRRKTNIDKKWVKKEQWYMEQEERDSDNSNKPLPPATTQIKPNGNKQTLSNTNARQQIPNNNQQHELQRKTFRTYANAVQQSFPKTQQQPKRYTPNQPKRALLPTPPTYTPWNAQTSTYQNTKPTQQHHNQFRNNKYWHNPENQHNTPNASKTYNQPINNQYSNNKYWDNREYYHKPSRTRSRIAQNNGHFL